MSGKGDPFAADPLAEVIVGEATAAHVLPFPTEAKVEYLPVVIPQPEPEREVEVVAPTAADDDLIEGSLDDTYVPINVQQRLLYYWLTNGPPGAASMVAPGPPIDEPVVMPFPYGRSDLPEPSRRRIGFGDDGLSRVLVLRE